MKPSNGFRGLRGYSGGTDRGGPQTALFFVRRTLSEEALGRPRLVKEIADFAEEALPLLTFGWAAIGQPKLGPGTLS